MFLVLAGLFVSVGAYRLYRPMFRLSVFGCCCLEGFAICRSSAVRPTLQTLALTQSSTSFSQYLFAFLCFSCLSLFLLVLMYPIVVNISERKSGTERTKKRKKRELVFSPTARGTTGTVDATRILPELR